MSLIPSVTRDSLTPALSADVYGRAATIAAGAKDFAITSEDDARSAADMMAAVRRGQKHLDDEYDKIARPVRAGLDAIRALFKPHQNALDAAMAALKDKHRAWVASENLRLAEERRRMAVAASRAAEQAAADAEALGGAALEELPPPAVVAVAAPPPITRGVEGKAYTRVVPRAEVVDFAAAPEAWFDFRSSLALAAFREAQKSGQAPSVADGPVVWRGVRFWNEASTVSA